MSDINRIMQEAGSLNHDEKVRLARMLLDSAKSDGTTTGSTTKSNIQPEKTVMQTSAVKPFEKDARKDEVSVTKIVPVQKNPDEADEKETFDKKIAEENKKIMEDQEKDLSEADDDEATRWDKFKSALFYPLPHRLLSSIVYRFMRIKNKSIKNMQIKMFSKAYHVDLHQAVISNIEDYQDFNSFFTRRLKPNLRPLASGERDICSPADGFISEIGRIEAGKIIQAKGHKYTVSDLLGGNKASAATFANGSFVTIYLSPANYHRVHMPVDGILKKTIHIPGRLFSVAPFTVKTVPGIFARNERVVSIFETPVGLMAHVLVGAMFVSSIETVWAGTITPPYAKEVSEFNYAPPVTVPSLKKGEEMGRFNMGSTVILLFPENSVEFSEALLPGIAVKMGEKIGEVFAV